VKGGAGRENSGGRHVSCSSGGVLKKMNEHQWNEEPKGGELIGEILNDRDWFSCGGLH